MEPCIGYEVCTEKTIVTSDFDGNKEQSVFNSYIITVKTERWF